MPPGALYAQVCQSGKMFLKSDPFHLLPPLIGSSDFSRFYHFLQQPCAESPVYLTLDSGFSRRYAILEFGLLAIMVWMPIALFLSWFIVCKVRDSFS